MCRARSDDDLISHVFRITKALGWTPAKANRETAFQHLDVRIPDENKYPVSRTLLKTCPWADIVPEAPCTARQTRSIVSFVLSEWQHHGS